LKRTKRVKRKKKKTREMRRMWNMGRKREERKRTIFCKSLMTVVDDEDGKEKAGLNC
jgi:hypothetical protein